MTRNVVKHACAAMALLWVTGVAVPSPAAAQGTVNVAGGYSFVHDSDVENFPAGWFASVGGGVNRWLEIVGETAGNYKTLLDIEGGDVKLRIHFVGAGPRFIGHSGRVHPFGQVLVGAAIAGASFGNFSRSQSDFAWQPGAGVDIDLASNVGVRVGANGRFANTDGETLKEFQFVAGVVFGRRR